jgi:hypothetical protein
MTADASVRGGPTTLKLAYVIVAVCTLCSAALLKIDPWFAVAGLAVVIGWAQLGAP